MITDRNGEPLAVSTPVASIWVNPQDLLRSPERIPELAQAVGMSVDELSSRLSQKSDKEFMYLRRRINPDEAEKVVALKIPGVAAQREFRRFYPQGEAMAHVLGFTNIDDRGRKAGTGLRRMAARQARCEAGDPQPQGRDRRKRSAACR